MHRPPLPTAARHINPGDVFSTWPNGHGAHVAANTAWSRERELVGIAVEDLDQVWTFPDNHVLYLIHATRVMTICCSGCGIDSSRLVDLVDLAADPSEMTCKGCRR
ncbi:hypothetical protein SAMN04489730_0137 [Amycolatopsis australiensis]|uniref:Uncharacterized protein n=1 Tax=Amycolatopsis australiensis TaxID=546364 RepID=A0A1K1LQC9_9PSEU|nr:hypothetical protein SAMN04489730_0137 [Amycolatopsis australiensis]